MNTKPDLTAGKVDGRVNVTYGSKDKDAARCSNFYPDAFQIDGIWFASVEAFYVYILFAPDDPVREQARVLVAFAAKKFGRRAERKYVWWQGLQMNFGSPEHHALLDRAIRARFEQNPDAMQSLRALRGYEILHDTGGPDSVGLPAAIFCDILTRIRDEE